VNLTGAAKQRHWEPTIKEQIRYRADIEYEQHFLSLFRQSLRRRTGPGAPMVAELSGGMDSSSIVCVSDQIRLGTGGSASELLDTVSRFDDSEPNWDERRYFSVVEAQRGKSGIHLNIGAIDHTFEPQDASEITRPSMPGIDRYAVARQKQFAEAIAAGNYRVILSGIGGDEVLGGVPTPLPELSDYLISFELRNLIGRALAFCMTDRTPLLHMLARTVASSAAAYWTLLPARIPVTSCSEPSW
jgi:asparagine synthase (glutamine-hydrolysing)